MKRNTPKVVFYVIGGILLFVFLSIFVQFVTHLLLEGAYEYTNGSMAVGIGMATAALWAVVLISVLFTLSFEGIVFVLLWNTIKQKLVAKLVDVAASFKLEVTPKFVWEVLFENKKESES